MLNVTLKPFNSQPSKDHLRGWVNDPKTGNTLLEFHNTATVNEAVLAFTALMPEVMDFLQLCSNHGGVAELLIDRMYQIRQQLENEANPKPKEEVT